MKTPRVVLAVLLLSLFPACLVSAGGWGGVSACGQYFDRSISGPTLGVSTVMAYGYGVNEEGDRIGGFGLGMISSSASAAGGAGGILLGHEWWLGPFVAGFNLEGGVGGTSVGSNGYLLLFGQAEVDLGIAWLQIVAYIGYQAAGNLFPGASFSAVKMAAPVLGMRVAWGGR